eukprot:s312_g9.t1
MGGDDNDDEEPQPVPRNRSEFYRLFNQKGPTNMICEFMSDTSLKFTARTIVDISFPLESSYYSTLEQVAQGWNSQCCWVSGRAVGEWLHTIHEITRVLESDLLHDHLDMTGCMRMVAPPEVWPPWALKEQERLNEAYVFAVALAENWLWANIHFWLEFPSVIACALHPEEEITTMAFNHMERLAKVVNAVERHERPLMKELLNDLGWNREQLARESMALVLQGRKDELRRLAKRLFTGTPSTKDCLENTFAFLHRKSQDYLVICPPVSMSLPLARDLCWMVNFDVDGDWRFVPVKRLVRALLPRALYESGRCFSWEITSQEYEPLLTSAVREGVWISLANIRQICHSLEVEPPRAKQGSGKGGAVVRVDWARKLVQHLFPGADAEEQKRMTAALTWKQSKGGLKEKERSVLEMVAELDEENREAPEFVKVVKLAKSRLKEQETKATVAETRKLVLAEVKRSELEEKERLEKAAQAAERAAEEEKARLDKAKPAAAAAEPSSSSGRNPSQTPKDIKDFLTPEMLAAKISLNRLPTGYGYRAYYTSRLLQVEPAKIAAYVSNLPKTK